jgi:hypothetical protein
VLRERGDVLAALAQRRQHEARHVQAVVEVLAERLVLDHLLELAVGGRDDAHVHLHRVVVAQAADLALLDGAQQLGLERRRGLGDLVEEERAAVGLLEQALARGPPRP